MSQTFSVAFRHRFQKAFEASDFSSYRSLSLATGWSESRIQRIITGQFDDSKDGPGFFGISRVCQHLNITPDYLAGVHRWEFAKEGSQPTAADTLNASMLLQLVEEKHQPPSVKQLTRTYVRSGGRIEAFSKFLDYCDIYDIPDHGNRLIKIRTVGPKSLAALGMGEANALLLQEAFDAATPELKEHFYDLHCRTIDAGILIGPDTIDEKMTNHPVHVKIDYLRISIKVTDLNGAESILVFCDLIPL